MRSSNPIFRDSVYVNENVINDVPMTVNGTIGKLFILFFVLILGAGQIFYKFSLGQIEFVNISLVVSALVSLVSALIISFRPNTAPSLSLFYAYGEGIFLSAITCYVEQLFPTIAIQAVSLTFLVFFIVLLLYKFRLIQATSTFRSVVISSTFAISVFYAISILCTYVFKINIPYFTNLGSTYNIVVNVVIAIIASMNLILDFDFIERASQRMMPKYFEWYGAFGLVVTLVWLYMEILRILQRVYSRK